MSQCSPIAVPSVAATETVVTATAIPAAVDVPVAPTEPAIAVAKEVAPPAPAALVSVSKVEPPKDQAQSLVSVEPSQPGSKSQGSTANSSPIQNPVQNSNSTTTKPNTVRDETLIGKIKLVKKRGPKVPWTEDEDATLRRIVKNTDVKNWQKIVEQMPTGRTPAQCAERWNKFLKPGMSK